MDVLGGTTVAGRDEGFPLIQHRLMVERIELLPSVQSDVSDAPPSFEEEGREQGWRPELASLISYGGGG